MNIEEALAQARKILGINYFMEPAAKEYIQKFKRAKNKKASGTSSSMIIKKEEILDKPTYKECLMKGVDPLDGSYIDWKIEEKFELIYPQWKKEFKDEILKEVKKEMHDKLEEIKKSCDEKFEIPFSDEDIMDIGGHGQKSE